MGPVADHNGRCVARLGYTTAKFAPPVASHGVLTPSWSDLIWASVTIGRRSWADVIQHGRHSYYEMIYRCVMLHANVAENTAGRLIASPAFRDLDPSEKSSISYFIGLTGAKLAAEVLFSVPWLMHLDRYRTLNPVLKGRSKPDLVGRNALAQWLVMEAKGRSNQAEKGLLQKAKTQTQQITRIAGAAPWLLVALVAQFDPNLLSLTLEDPPVRDNGVQFAISPNRFMRDYYQPFIDLLANVRSTTMPVMGRRYRVAALEGVGVQVGLDEEVYGVMKSADPHADSTVVRVLANSPKSIGAGESVLPRSQVDGADGGPPPTVGGDGVLIIADESWSTEAMRRRAGSTG